ncbi:MAG: hypothetical protein GY832_23680 [Chloroflexi bacterium]|nr:hypothetical protein [Chloroflexota bacterium]
MAKPTGGLEPTDFPYVVKGEPDGGPFLWDHMYALFNLPTCPRHWSSNFTVRRQKYYLDWLSDAGATTTLRGFWRFHSATTADTFEQYTTTSNTFQWGNGDLPATTVANLKGKPQQDFTADPENAKRYAPVDFLAQHTNGDNDCYIGALYFEGANDEAYTDPSPAGAAYASPVEKDTAASRVYKEHRPVSSYAMMTAGANTLNNLIYEVGMAWTLPMFGGS